MKRTTWVILLGLVFSIPPTWAQQLPGDTQSVAVPLEQVKKVHVFSQPDGHGFEALLIERLKSWGQFEIVADPRQPHDVVLSIAYGCDWASFRFVEVSRKADWTFCFVGLWDVDLLKRKLPTTVWEIPLGVLQDLFVASLKVKETRGREEAVKALADGIVAQLRKDWEVAAGRRQPDPQRTLGQLGTIYVARGDFSGREDTNFELVLFSQLAKFKNKKLVGGCEPGQDGWESFVSGVKLACALWEADAVLVSAGPFEAGRSTRYAGTSHGTILVNEEGDYAQGTVDLRHRGRAWEEVISGGGAVLFDRRIGKVLWSTVKDDDAPTAAKVVAELFGGSAPGPGGSQKVAERIVKQLRKDWEKARK